MKIRTQNLQSILLAAAMALPLAAYADGPGDEAPGAPEAPGHGPRADDRRGPPPGFHEGLREGEDIDGPRGGPRGPGFGPGFAPAFGPGFNLPPHLHGLALTEAQQDKIFTIVHGQVPYLRDQAKARDKAERALFDLHGAAKYDDAAAVKLAQAAAQADANITLSHLRTEQKVLAVLTAEQRKTLEERNGERNSERNGARPPHRDREQGPDGGRESGRPGPHESGRPANPQ